MCGDKKWKSEHNLFCVDFSKPILFRLSVTGAQQVVTISNLSNENRQLREENSTLKLLYNENTAQVNTLAMISAALSSNEESVNRNLQPTPTHVENELQDTECAICKEEMRFPKCTTCRKKFHERVGVLLFRIFQLKIETSVSSTMDLHQSHMPSLSYHYDAPDLITFVSFANKVCVYEL